MEVVWLVLLIVILVVDFNVVRLNWSYNGNVVSGFCIFWDEILVVDVFFNVRSYYDMEGFLNFILMYSVVVLLSRENMVY